MGELAPGSQALMMHLTTNNHLLTCIRPSHTTFMLKYVHCICLILPFLSFELVVDI